MAKFLAETDGDAVVLQKVGKPNGALLRQALQSRYPYSVGDWGIIILSPSTRSSPTAASTGPDIRLGSR